MNTRSSTSRQPRSGNLNRFASGAAIPGSRAVYRTPKRLTSRRSRPAEKPQRSPEPLCWEEGKLRQQAMSEAQQGNYDESIALFTQLIDRHPTSAPYYNNRGLVYFQTGQLDCALADYNKALQLNPNLDSVYNNRANYYAAQGQLLEAILDYNMAIDLNPTNIRAWINQGITFRDLKMYDRAIECFDLALPLGRLQGHIYAERGRAYQLRGDWNCAMADYQRSTKYLPLPCDLGNDPSVRLRLQVEVWLDELISPLEA